MSALREVARPASAETFLSEPRSGVQPTPARLPVLLPEHVLALRYFFCEYESALGHVSTFGAMAAQLAMGRKSAGGSVDFDGPQERMASVVDSRANRRARRIRAALLAMVEAGRSRELTVLFRLYGPTAPGEARREFGDVAAIVDMTRAVEETRRELADATARRRADSVDAIASETPEAIAAEFWRTAARWSKADARARRLEAMPDVARQWDAHVERFWMAAGLFLRATEAGDEARAAKIHRSLGRRLSAGPDRIGSHYERAREARLAADSLRAMLRGLLHAYDRGPARAAKATIVSGAHREVTHADALRWALAYHGPHDADGKPNRDAQASWKPQRAAFVLRVRRQAERLRNDAARAFLAAWEAA